MIDTSTSFSRGFSQRHHAPPAAYSSRGASDHIREIDSLHLSMHFLRCPSCGAKALASASRCPRCTKPFDLIDGRGERMKLVPCRSCEVLLPENVQQCPWCKTERRKRSLALPLGVGAIAVAAILGVFVIRARTRAHDEGASVAALTPPQRTQAPAAPAPIDSVVSQTPPPLTPAPAVASDSAAGSRSPTAASPTVPPPSAAPMNAPQTAASVTPPPAPDGEWEPATATTWINVRSAARVDAPVVRIVKPNDVVQLGAKAGGWRLVKGGGFSGWAGARHFALNSR